jgi:hypothetical protein
MKRTVLCGLLLILFATAVHATTVRINCNMPGPLGKISTALKLLNTHATNTIKISGVCRENLLITQFDNLSLIAEPGAEIVDNSGEVQPVINITDSREVTIQGFKITGGSTGVMCFDASLCRFSGNTIERSAAAGVWVNHSQATFAGDIIQDTGDPGLGIQASKVAAGGLTVQRSSGVGIYDSNGSVLEAWAITIQGNRADGVLVISQSHLFMGESTVSNNAYNGIDVNDQSEVLLLQNIVITNGYNGVAVGDLSLANLGGGGTFTGNSTDIICGDKYSVAKLIQGATYGTTNCPLPQVQTPAVKQQVPQRLIIRPPAE